MSFKSRFIVDVDVFDVEKRFEPSKYYVYCIWVTWSNNEKKLIYRRFSQFFDFQCKLLDKFKKEAGADDPFERVIPFLPGKIIFGRSQIKSVAYERMFRINIYCKKLITLKDEIAQSDIVLNFFQLTNDDISFSTKKSEISIQPEVKSISNPSKGEQYLCIKEYVACGKNETTIITNEKCFVIEKNLSGWWFIVTNDSKGYVPGICLQPLNKHKNTEDSENIVIANPETHIVKENYNAQRADEISISKGDFVSVLEKNYFGWWKIKKIIDSKVGVVPAVFLAQVEDQSLNVKKEPAISAFDLYGKTRDLIDMDFSNDSSNRDFAQSLSRKSSINSHDSRIYENIDNLTFDQYQQKKQQNQNEDSNSLINFNDTFNLNQKSDEVYYSIEDYIDTIGDGLNIKKGEKFMVLDKEDTFGWWLVVRLEDSIMGYAPGSFLSKIKPLPPRPPKPKIASTLNSAKSRTSSIDLFNNQNQNKSILIDEEKNHQNNDFNTEKSNKQDFNSNDNINAIEEEYKPVRVSDMKKKFESFSKKS